MLSPTGSLGQSRLFAALLLPPQTPSAGSRVASLCLLCPPTPCCISMYRTILKMEAKTQYTLDRHAHQDYRLQLSRWKLRVSCKPNINLKSHHLCSILWVRSKSMGQPTFEGRGLYKGVNTRGRLSLEASKNLPAKASK